jgi:hypothetical protein
MLLTALVKRMVDTPAGCRTKLRLEYWQAFRELSVEECVSRTESLLQNLISYKGSLYGLADVLT